MSRINVIDQHNANPEQKALLDAIQGQLGMVPNFLKVSHLVWRSARPNPSLERTSTGLALGPRGFSGYRPPRGPSANPAGSAQLKR